MRSISRSVTESGLRRRIASKPCRIEAASAWSSAPEAELGASETQRQHSSNRKEWSRERTKGREKRCSSSS